MITASLTGMSRNAGGALAGVDHLQQSIDDILTTPIGSRVMRPEYGSKLPRIVDQPVTRGWMSEVQAEVARALGRWEPRLILRRATVESVIDGKVSIRISGEYQGETVLFEATV
jgi:phage baseplate assembly protein W